MFRANARWALCAIAIAVAGCGALKGKRGVNMTPFAENTIALVSDLRLETQQPVYLREFMMAQPQTLEARATGMQMRDMIRGIIFYSLQVSAIGSSGLSEGEKARYLARYLDEALRARVRRQPTEVRLTEQQLDSILANVGQQTEYLSALRAAEPIITTVVEVSDALVTRFDSLVAEAQAAIVASVERAYAPTRENLRDLGALEARLMHAFVLLSRYRLGDAAALDSVRAAEPSLPLPARPTAAQLTQADTGIIERLATIRQLREQLGPERATFEARRTELDAIVRGATTTSRAIRSSILLWSRAHRSMADGIALPPDIDVGGLLRGAAGKLPGL